MLVRIVTFAGISVVIYFLIAVALVLTDAPPDLSDTGPGKEPIAFAKAMEADYSGLPDALFFKARDGTDLAYRRYDSVNDAAPIILLVHGSAWNSMQWHPMAEWLSSQGLATVIAPDMRGHGVNPPPKGDVGYIGQMEDDIADLITVIKKTGGLRKVILAGHSSGGGFAVRFAGGPHGGLADGYILMAPFLKYNAPTTRENSGGWARPATRRIIGLTMLNAIRFPALNHLPVISFAMPDTVLTGPYGQLATTAYTYRLNTGFAPRSDFESDLAAIQVPLLVVAGDKDEAFHSGLYEEVIAAQTRYGSYFVLPDVNHIGVVMGEETRPILKNWIGGNFPGPGTNDQTE